MPALTSRYSGDAKDEIARVRFERSCCPGAFVRGASRFSNAGRSQIIVATERSAVARAALAAAKAAGIDAVADRTRTARLADRTMFTVRPAVPFSTATVPARSCCRRAWLRGAFLASGSVSDPARSYHLEFFCRRDDDARALCEALASVSVDAGISRRRGRPLAYVKGAESIADLLGQMGATQAVFALDNVRAVRQTKNDIRRRVNSESANAARAASSSARHREAAMRAIRSVGLSRLGPALAQAAQLRIAHPELTLAELAERARPRVTKAAMGYRMRALALIGKPARTRRGTAKHRQ
ncbi:MAG TPA: DNA-binding protein WhiA [Candidatus Eremiobacteraceae bacterium]|nr:DNA-binding protein WhiA [Candidatus Eremiobacteraceae bacterium]